MHNVGTLPGKDFPSLYYYRNTVPSLSPPTNTASEWKVKIGTHVLAREASLDPLRRPAWYDRYAQPSRGLQRRRISMRKKACARARGAR